MIANLVLEWFKSNYTKLSQDKSDLLVSRYKHKYLSTNWWSKNLGEFKTNIIRGSKDRDLRFNEYVSSLC